MGAIPDGTCRLHAALAAPVLARVRRDREEARAMAAAARRGDTLGRAMKAGIERQVAGDAEAAEHVHSGKGDSESGDAAQPRGPRNRPLA